LNSWILQEPNVCWVNCGYKVSVVRTGDSNSSCEADSLRFVCYARFFFCPSHFLWCWYLLLYLYRNLPFSHKDILSWVYIFPIVNSFLFVSYQLSWISRIVSDHEIHNSPFICSYVNVESTNLRIQENWILCWYHENWYPRV